MDIVCTIQKFLDSWEHKDILNGVLLTGSRSVGNHAENSDIDLQILLSDDTFRERGNQIVDGMLIEYFANPSVHIRRYLEGDRSTARMYATGTILYDPHGHVEKACEIAREILALPVPPLTDSQNEAMKYSIWDAMDDVEALYQQRADSFGYVYQLNLNKVLSLYGRYLGVELPSPSKQQAYFENAEFRERYGLGEFPDTVFSDLFIRCIRADSSEEQYEALHAIGDHVLRELGGFDIDGWRSVITA